MKRKIIPEKYEHTTAESSWATRWRASGIYRYDPAAPREQTFVVDTPPPTASGALHVGHVFSYTQQDLIARYQRMRGKNVCFPIGWDDNGLPTERRVEQVFGIRCDPTLPYDPQWRPTRPEEKMRAQYVSRSNFIEACAALTLEDERVFESLYTALGISYDWSLQYATIDDHCRRTSQRAFLTLLREGEVYQTVAPTMWDTRFRTAVAQAEVEERTVSGVMYDFTMQLDGCDTITLSTTRPELLPACVAVVAHPDDERYQKLFGRMAITPLFHVPVPIIPADHVDPQKGTGIMMICTFGDTADVAWWKKTSGIPVKVILDASGRMRPVTFGESPFVSNDADVANRAYAGLVGVPATEAKKRIAAMLTEAGVLVGQKPVEQPVKFYEKGDTPIEFLSTRQWFVRLLEHRDDFLKMGRRIAWYPPHMRTRYEHWVSGLNQDWCISRQRYFGVPFPIWYRVDEAGKVDYNAIILPKLDALPVDPLAQAPPGFDKVQRNQPGGFSGDPDVMDTWATSALTPQITSHWVDDPERHRRLFPADIRPQSHEIIRTWAFYTIVQAWMLEREIPWKNVLISGWILDPDRKKMSKSKGNVVTPEALIWEHSADAIRYWAAKARLGADTAFDPALFRVGRRLATKIFNASRFVAQYFAETPPATLADETAIVEPIDKALLARLATMIHEATASFDGFDYAGSLQTIEDSFWNFCDNYLEFVKVRAYDESATVNTQSARATLARALRAYLLLFAPFQPFVTEDVWSWTFAESEPDSVHARLWPTPESLLQNIDESNPEIYDVAAEIVAKVRGAKSAAQRSLRTPVKRLIVTAPEGVESLLRSAENDIRRVCGLGLDSVFEVSLGVPATGSRADVQVDF